ncbi:MAG: glucosyl-dolichyl phosphate glucuronosyltransferase [Actinomycetota bacterium]|jgi:GT2 family glycosyltransferase|nr:glucosyl-dolichyl phosphate glucuronosyltransferase [Actinomycetota bacterium]
MTLVLARPAPLEVEVEVEVGTTLSVSVIICAYTLDRWADIIRAVESVQKQRATVDEVVVVIDHNPDLLDRARGRWPHARPTTDEAAGPEVVVVASTGMRGLSGARNTGLGVARSQIVAFLDDDARAEDSWIERLLPAYENPDVVACGGAAVPALTGPRPGWWPVEFDWIVGCSYLGLPTSPSVVRNLIGANMSARRQALLAIGGFGEGIGRVGSRPVGCEETDLFIRLVERWPAARVVYDPAARVHHTVPADRLSWTYFRARCLAEGLSKAQVAARVGSERALASERSYVRGVLPRGVATAMRGAVRGDPLAGRRALAIGAGLAMTTAGYVRARYLGRGAVRSMTRSRVVAA